MIISIVPDYDLFVHLLFIYFIIKCFTEFISGLLQIEFLKRDNAGAIEIFRGTILFIIVCIILF